MSQNINKFFMFGEQGLSLYLVKIILYLMIALGNKISDEFEIYESSQNIYKLTQRIDRRLQIGYYCPVETSLTHRPLLPAKRLMRLNEAKTVKIYKKIRKQVSKVMLVDQCQNTSGIFTKKSEDMDCLVKQEQKQVQCSVEQANASVQQGEEIECCDIQIQCEEEEKLIQMVEIIKFIEPPKTEIQTTAIQAIQDTKNAGFQYIDPCPITKVASKIQVALPDLAQEKRLKQLESRIQSVKKESKKKDKESQNKIMHLEIQKAKQIINCIQNQIVYTEHRQNNLKSKLEEEKIELQRNARKRKIEENRKKEQQHQMYLKMKQEEERKKLIKMPMIDKDYLSARQLCEYRNEAQKLRFQLLTEMKKGLSILSKSNSQENPEHMQSTNTFRQKKRIDSHKVGKIIKNQFEQSKLNQNITPIRQLKAQLKSRSHIDYSFEQVAKERAQRKNRYEQKIKANLNLSVNHLLDKKSKYLNETGRGDSARYTNRSLFMSQEQARNMKGKIQQLLNYELSATHPDEQIQLAHKLISLVGITTTQQAQIGLETKDIFIVRVKDSYHTYTFQCNSSKKRLTFLKLLHQNKALFNSSENQVGFQYINHTFYAGKYKNGLKQGEGILLTPKILYKGQFQNNHFSGDGFIKFSNGDFYKGHFHQGLFEGEGIYEWKQGEYYDGYFLKGMKSGYGVMNFMNGDREEGLFKGNICVEGIYKSKSGQSYCIQGNVMQKCTSEIGTKAIKSIKKSRKIQEQLPLPMKTHNSKQ